MAPRYYHHKHKVCSLDLSLIYSDIACHDIFDWLLHYANICMLLRLHCFRHWSISGIPTNIHKYDIKHHTPLAHQWRSFYEKTAAPAPQNSSIDWYLDAGLFHSKTRVFFCCGNSAALLKCIYGARWRIDVFPKLHAASKTSPPTGPI